MARTPFVWLSVAAAALLCSVFEADAKPVGKPGNRFPLVQNSNFKRNATASVLRAKSKYARFSVNSLSEGDGVVPMTDYEYDVEYYGVVSVGTPPQDLKLDFDTGSADLWFASEGCTNCGSSQTLFQPSESSTFSQPSKIPWSISYGDGSTAGGYLAQDTVTLGGYAIKNQTIDLASKESSSFQNGPIDGLLGLAFNTITSVEGIKTPMDNLVSQGLISEPIFGVYLGKASESGGGEYYFGGYNQDHIAGDLTTVPIDNSQGFWGVTVDAYKTGGKTLVSDSAAILDTGTSLLILADDIVSAVADAYGATANGDGTYTISCDTSSYEPLELVINGATFQVPTDSLIYVEQGGVCYAGFASAGMDFSIIGDTFLKNNYVIYNTEVPEVQIAPSKA
ncbi:Syncephapepsin [Dichotomocladium elegans]|nr:Syncephapepsin [Dichotomocladium elegans]